MTRTKRVIALVAAAGQGTRLGAAVPKAYVELQGRTLLERSVAAMEAAGVDEIIVTVSPDMESTAQALLSEVGVPLKLVHGAGERADSVWAGLQAIEAEDAVVLIHDAARALTPPEMIRRVIDAVEAGKLAVIPVLPVTDTIKEVNHNTVIATPNRANLRAVQTPQGFDLAQLREANEAYFSGSAGFVATDDASLMEWHNVDITCVDGDALALKITTPIDLILANALLEEH